ncbi:MAG: hypothetical protein WD770_04930 [Actinomycetota bacterium]
MPRKRRGWGWRGGFATFLFGFALLTHLAIRGQRSEDHADFTAAVWLYTVLAGIAVTLGLLLFEVRTRKRDRPARGWSSLSWRLAAIPIVVVLAGMFGPNAFLVFQGGFEGLLLALGGLALLDLPRRKGVAAPQRRAASRHEQSLISHLLSIYPDAEELLEQIHLVRVVGDPASGLELHVLPSAPKADIADGPVPVAGVVVGADGGYDGELWLRVVDGRLAELEVDWATEDLPVAWPPLERIRLETVDPDA